MAIPVQTYLRYVRKKRSAISAQGHYKRVGAMCNQSLYRIFISSALILGFTSSSFSAGKVYLVIGSDTAIWDGMNTRRYNCTYDQSLFTDPSRNAYTVMDPTFRADLVDSYGQPMKMTWWMMAGNIFRYATNTNIPVPNIMTLYLMKKYHGENVIRNGDELSLHYHTFYWSDYDQDGIYYWNQSKTFMESLDDFNVTLAQFLLEEQVFPVSFRSGWHYMDNDWQKYLDESVLPYSMHNDYPAKRTEDSEPIDNIFDWSQAPSTFLPYHPSSENYQIPGDGPGWQVRSASFWKTRVNDYMDTVFAAAQQGTDQVACFWAHLPEIDFPENMQMIDSLAHHYASIYTDVEFKYCTAIEAMQLWRQSSDEQAPTLNFSDEIVGDAVYFNIEVDEIIFQQQPFVAVKNIYEESFVLECTQTSVNQWKTIESVPLNTLAKAGVTVCDTMGNQSMEFLSYLPDDAFIDNVDAGYNELHGDWSTSTTYSWGLDSRITTLVENDSVLVSWTYQVPQSTYYNIFIQFPDITNQAEQRRFLILNNQLPLDTIKVSEGVPVKQWVFLSTVQAVEGSDIKVEMSASGQNQSGKNLTADVLKITPLVRERDIEIKEGIIDFGQVSVEDTINYFLKISNTGIHDLQISTLHSLKQLVSVKHTIPFSIPPMASVIVPLSFVSIETGIQKDTLEIHSNDPADPLIKLLVSADVMKYFHTIDNEDSDQYEEFGNWKTSVANIYGPTSRYAGLNNNPLASARFYTTLSKNGTYDILEIVPSTVNSTDDALYEVKIDGVLQASYHVNQNQGSGNWVTIGTLNLPANTEIEIWLKDTGNSTIGQVIRSDAVRFQLIDESTAIDDQEKDQMIRTFKLEQNYPNPFNPKTTIKYQLPKSSLVNLTIYNLLGQKVAILVSAKQVAGTYKIEWDATRFASGVYYYKLETSSGFVQSKKLILLK